MFNDPNQVALVYMGRITILIYSNAHGVSGPRRELQALCDRKVGISDIKLR